MLLDSKIHFLVVNDSDVIQRVLVTLLKEIGYLKVSEAEDGVMAWRALATSKSIGSPVDFIITDCSMPLMDGLQLIRTIRRDPNAQALPILMVSSRAKAENIVAAIDAGANGYLVKPFKAPTLRKKVEALLVSQGLIPARVLY